MAKPGKKSIADLIATRPQPRKPSAEEIDAITSKIHHPQNAAQEKVLHMPEKTKRISINAPIQLYINAKTKATLKEQTLMAYVMGLIEADVG